MKPKESVDALVAEQNYGSCLGDSRDRIVALIQAAVDEERDRLASWLEAGARHAREEGFPTEADLLARIATAPLGGKYLMKGARWVVYEETACGPKGGTT